MEESNEELESFRRKWREEVSAKAKAADNEEFPPSQQSGTSKSTGLRTSRKPSNKVPGGHEDHFEPHNYTEAITASSSIASGLDNPKQGSREPRTALEFYEKAVERENQGSLGDSLGLYRRAFKLDDKVEQKYKNKHYPPSTFAPKPVKSNEQENAIESKAAPESGDGIPLTLNQLIAGFSGLSIEPVPPAVEGTTAPPCPIASIPEEILIHIFMDVAIHDIAAFVRLGQVCKRMAFIVATEESIWKRVCLGNEVGFGGMHYDWQREVLGEPIEEEVQFFTNKSLGDADATQQTPLEIQENITNLLYRDVYKSWHEMFHLRPRIRFNGCYISTNNYIRPGQGEQSRHTWNTPIHIVTYYRYLRFFRDGSVISLLSNSEPGDVIHYMTKELLGTHRIKGTSNLPSAVMHNALNGRWRLTSVDEKPEVSLKEGEGDLCIETEGVDPKYIYRMDLSLRHAGKRLKNNKLAWNGFWSYNKVTDDWAEFTRRNEKPLFFSRVKSYGRGA